LQKRNVVGAYKVWNERVRGDEILIIISMTVSGMTTV